MKGMKVKEETMSKLIATIIATKMISCNMNSHRNPGTEPYFYQIFVGKQTKN
jgi:hypothetical protein